MRFGLISLALVLLSVCPTATGQAVTEYGLGAGRAATTTAPTGSLTKGIGGAFDGLTKVAGADGKPTPFGPASQSPAPRRTAATKAKVHAHSRQSTNPSPTETGTVGETETTLPPPPPPPVHEDPKLIQAGMGYEEIVSRFGPPSMSITTGPGKSTLWYSNREGNRQVEVSDGKAVSVMMPE